jgi:hypothetical protein
VNVQVVIGCEARRITISEESASMMNRISWAAAVIASAGLSASVAAPSNGVVSLSADPLVMRLSKDEFRIAFGLDGAHCMPSGCSGQVHYRVHWTASDGTTRWETKAVSYHVAPNASRTVAVDRQYLDTAEGAHTIDAVEVSVHAITIDQAHRL